MVYRLDYEDDVNLSGKAIAPCRAYLSKQIKEGNEAAIKDIIDELVWFRLNTNRGWLLPIIESEEVVKSLKSNIQMLPIIVDHLKQYGMMSYEDIVAHVNKTGRPKSIPTPESKNSLLCTGGVLESNTGDVTVIDYLYLDLIGSNLFDEALYHAKFPNKSKEQIKFLLKHIPGDEVITKTGTRPIIHSGKYKALMLKRAGLNYFVENELYKREDIEQDVLIEGFIKYRQLNAEVNKELQADLSEFENVLKKFKDIGDTREIKIKISILHDRISSKLFRFSRSQDEDSFNSLKACIENVKKDTETFFKDQPERFYKILLVLNKILNGIIQLLNRLPYVSIKERPKPISDAEKQWKKAEEAFSAMETAVTNHEQRVTEHKQKLVKTYNEGLDEINKSFNKPTK